MASNVPPLVNDEERRTDVQLEPHLIRITNHGKIQAWVTFALEFFKNNDGRPLILHTLPANKREPTAKEPATAPSEADAPPNVVDGKCNSTSASTIPRLITVVEIIKREYLKALKPSSSVMIGLHQYNEVGCLEDLGDDNVGDTNTLASALQGKTHLTRKQRPFMRVTLCRGTLPNLTDKRVTYQPSAVRKLSKSAKRRMKTRLEAEAKGRVAANCSIAL